MAQGHILFFLRTRRELSLKPHNIREGKTLVTRERRSSSYSMINRIARPTNERKKQRLKI